MMTIARVFRVAGVAALLLGLFGVRAAQTANIQRIAESGKNPPRAGQAAPVADVLGERVFEFEKRTGPVDEALAVVLGRRPVPDDAAEAGEIMTKVAKARATLRSNSQAAAAAVIADLDKLRRDDVEGHAALFSLLEVVADETLRFNTGARS